MNSVYSLMLVLFVGLKLTDNIDWSWWWVLAPVWGPLVVWSVIWGLATLTLVALGGKDD